MRGVMLATLCLGLTACSARSDHDKPASRELASDQMASPTEQVAQPAGQMAPAAMVAPGIAVTAAPGVAFNYDYAFRLPPDRISAAQEAHAQACEKLGVARCRITGMQFRLVGENNVEAMLAFKLEPAIARAFGKNGIAVVDAAQGRLVLAEITGTDAGAAIGQLDTQRARAESELRRTDAELANSGRSASERSALQQQRAELVRTIAAANDNAGEQRASLATTPMTFRYESGNAVRGFDTSAPISSAMDTAIGSVQFTLAFVLGALALLGPPALVAGLGWLAWRRVRPRRRANGGNGETMA